MWIKTPIYHYIPAETKTGKQYQSKMVIEKPSPEDCWFSFAHSNDMENLSYMLNRGFDINTVKIEDNDFENIGMKAVRDNNLRQTRFFIKNKGNICLKSVDNDTMLSLCLFRRVSYSVFKAVYDHYISIYSSFLPDNLSDTLEYEDLTVLLNSDKNLLKIKYFINQSKIENRPDIKEKFLSFIEENKIIDIPKIMFFLKGNEELLNKLKNTLKVNKTNYKIRKI